MPLIKIETEINSTLEICFDLSRSIDLHKISTAETKERAVEGVTTGLISYNESVTWQARHFGITQKLTSQITVYNRPFHFRDEQVNGIFKRIQHDHYFEQKDAHVLMTDEFLFESPLGILGSFFNWLVLTRYLRKFLVKRNQVIKHFAETDKWKDFLLS